MSASLFLNVVMDSGKPVVGASVKLVPSGLTAITDAGGKTSFSNIPPGKYQVSITKGELRPKKLAGAPVSLSGVSVTVTGSLCNQVTITMVKPRRKVIYLDIEHQHLRDREAAAQESHKDVVGAAAKAVIPGVTAQRVWYGDFTTSPDDDTLAVFISGNCAEWSWYTNGNEKASDGEAVGSTPALDAIKRFINTTSVPIVAVCGGHQLVAMAMLHDDKAVGHIDFAKLGVNNDAEDDKTLPVALTAAGGADPIFKGVTPQFRFFHHDEVRALPDSALLLGVTPVSTVQALKYRLPNRVMYTSQFHPEQDEAGYTNGRQYLQNFFQLASDYWETQT
jgi:GMP synthase-like glutamine amidotransferase